VSKGLSAWLHPKARRPGFLLATLGIALVMFIGVGAFAKRFQIGISDEEVQSLSHSWFLIDTKNQTVPVGEYVVFRINRDLPPWPAGSRFVKKVAAVEGDVVVVSQHATTVNGEVVAGPLDLLTVLGKPATAFERSERVGASDVFVVGENAHSYDSRYWGNVGVGQIIGRGYPLW